MPSELTPAILSRSIYSALATLRIVQLIAIKDHHPRAYALVHLHHDGLASPTAKSRGMLLEMWEEMECWRIGAMETRRLARFVGELVNEPVKTEPETASPPPTLPLPSYPAEEWRSLSSPSPEEAEKNLREAGAVLERRQDMDGDTRSGWFQDGIYLSANPVQAWQLLNGDCG